MKKMVRSIAAVALMFSMTSVMANEPKLRLSTDAEKSLTFQLDTDSRDTKVSIVDSDGNVIYTDNIQGVELYTKKFDLGNLASGSYFLVVENELREISYNIDVNASDIEILDRDENAKPVFRKTGEKVFLNLLNLDQKDVKVKVVDSEGRIVFKETISDTMLIEKAFNFENAFDDKYTIMVVDGDNSYYEDVLVK